MRKNTTNLDDAKITAATLNLAAKLGWEKVTLEAIAQTAKIPVEALKKRFTSPHHLVPVIAETIDAEAFVTMPSGSTHDILFDLLMARFDILQKNREAILSMAEASRHDRKLSCALACAALRGADRIIDKAQLSKPPRPVLGAGLVAVYGWAFNVWRHDESRDMAKTMAATDRALRIAGKVAELVTQRS
jgi:AcrR family transcriptional regulator